MNECFAYKSNPGKGGFSCVCLNVKACPGKACRFYKTKEQVREEQEKCRERLKKLNADEKIYIMQKYGIRL